MADDVRVTNFPDSGSKERVALDLASKIAFAESGTVKTRAYWLDLYFECLSVASGIKPKHGQ